MILGSCVPVSTERSAARKGEVLRRDAGLDGTVLPEDGVRRDLRTHLHARVPGARRCGLPVRQEPRPPGTLPPRAAHGTPGLPETG